MKRGHCPQRTCLGCGTRDDKKGLLRVGVRSDGELHLDRVGRGRGGYLHKKEACWEAFLRRKKHYRAFRHEMQREAKEKLIQEIRDRRWE